MGKNNLVSPWTEERVDLLRKLWATGVSAQGIARQIGISKNGVVGKAHRMKLASRPSPIRLECRKKAYDRRRHVLAAPTEAAPRPAPTPARANPPHAAKVSSGIRARIRGDGVAVRKLATLGPPPRTCQFIEADKASFTDADKCGAETAEDSAYCPGHHARCWRPRPLKEAA